MTRFPIEPLGWAAAARYGLTEEQADKRRVTFQPMTAPPSIASGRGRRSVYQDALDGAMAMPGVQGSAPELLFDTKKEAGGVATWIRNKGFEACWRSDGNQWRVYITWPENTTVPAPKRSDT